MAEASPWESLADMIEREERRARRRAERASNTAITAITAVREARRTAERRARRTAEREARREARRIRTMRRLGQGTPARTTRRIRLQNLHMATPVEERLAEPVTRRRRPRTLLNFMRNSTIGCFNGICRAFTQRTARPILHSRSSIAPLTVIPNHITMRSVPPVNRLMHDKILYRIPEEGNEEREI